MEELRREYLKQIATPSDINEHLKVMYTYAIQCDHITELGVRFGTSTWAFLAALPKTLRSYDINPAFFKDKEKAYRLAKLAGVDYTFTGADVLTIDLEETDLLFIDTLHTYSQLSKELERHSEKVRKFIVMHDTNTFGNKDEVVYKHASDIARNHPSGKVGLMTAVTDFLKDNQQWKVVKFLTNNNGLTILGRN